MAADSPFDPAQAGHTWRLAATDYTESTLVLPVLARLRVEAPGTRLAVLELVPAKVARQAEQGEIDLAFHTTEGAPPALHRRALFSERYVLAGRAGHPRLRRRPTLAQFCALDHVIVSQDGGGFRGVTDEVLAARGLTRRVALSVPHFLFLLSALAGSDLVAMVPERLVRGVPALRVVEPPVEVPGFEISMLWPERVHRDAAHRWLRDLIVAAV